MKLSFLKKIALILSFGALVLVAVSFVFIADPKQVELVQANEGHNLVGYAWSENIGWISFNCMNQDKVCENNQSVMCGLDSDCVDAGVGGVCLSECSNSNYGVTISDSNGKFSGYAWSSNVGWIDFGPLPPYPNSPNKLAEYDSVTGDVIGWAKILSQGDDGWIKMSDLWSNGVSVNNLTFSGWAWNGNSNNSGAGWISFNCADSGVCAASDYSVSLNRIPSAINLEKSASVYCEYPGPKKDVREVLLRWSFSDSNSEDTQKAYELILSANPGYASPLISTGKVINSSAGQYAVSLSDGLQYDTTYYWRVRVWDNHGYVSDWSESSFKTDKHAYPDITSFTTDPVAPRALEDTFFSSIAKTYGGSYVENNGWLFTSSDIAPASISTSTASSVDLGGGVIESTTQNAGPAQFQPSSSSSGPEEVLVKVTDTDGYFCEMPFSLDAQISLPIWREVRPQ